MIREEIIQAMGLLHPTRQGPKQSALAGPTLSIRIRLDNVLSKLNGSVIFMTIL